MMNNLAKIGLATAAGVIIGKTALKNTKIPGLGGVKKRKSTKKRKSSKKRKTSKKR